MHPEAPGCFRLMLAAWNGDFWGVDLPSRPVETPPVSRPIPQLDNESDEMRSASSLFQVQYVYEKAVQSGRHTFEAVCVVNHVGNTEDNAEGMARGSGDPLIV